MANTKSPTPLGLSPTPDATMNSGSQVVTVSSNEFNTENPRLGFVTNRNADPNHLNSVLGKEPGGKVVVPSQPSNQPNPPTTVGRHLNLLPHETASERLLKLMDVLAEKDRQIESLSLQETGLNELIRQKDEKLQAAAREIRQARRDVANAQEQLDQLKQSVRSLHEKVQTSERENAEVLRTLTPLLQQLLNDEDEVAPMPTQVSEKPE
ncbi:MAG: hypothetical protein FJ267_19685 [Planctomycetes bacterium]|nr:hypothetical protein [Planctomycetota bacterium]